MRWLKRLFSEKDKDVLDKRNVLQPIAETLKEIEWMEELYGPAPAPTSEEIAWMDAPKLILRGICGECAERIFEISEKQYLIGTHSSANLCIQSMQASQFHAEIFWQEEEWHIKCTSENGMQYDEKKMLRGETAVLQNGSVIQIGGDCFAVVLVEKFRKHNEPAVLTPKPTLRGISGECAGKKFEVLTERYSIGRWGFLDLCIPKPYVSRSHAEIIWLEKEWFIKCTSKKGLLLDGKPIQQEDTALLKNGAVIELVKDECFEVLLDAAEDE